MNFIFFNPDEMRASATHCYGNSAAQTPHLNRLASEGTRFAQATCQSTLCSPSRCSFLTGWYPHVAGHRSLTHLLKPHEPNLLKSLRQHGYDVLYWGKNDTFSAESAKESVRLPGPSTREHLKGIRNFPPHPPGQLGDNGYYSFLYEPLGPSEEYSLDYWNVDAAVQYIAQKPEQPFALFLALDHPHPPYTVPQPFYDLIDPDSLPPLLPPIKEGKPGFHEYIRQYRELDELDDDFLRKLHAVYLGQTAYSDYLLGRLITALKEAGLEEETAVFFFSDHGDYAGDYGLVEKWYTGMEDVLTQVPFVAKIPGGKAGQVVDAPVELIDLAPTVLELAGIEPESPHFARSQKEVLMGTAEADAERVTFCEGGYSEQDAHATERLNSYKHLVTPDRIYYPKIKMGVDHPETYARTIMARSTSHKLIYRMNDESELYDLKEDPTELRNRWGDPQYADIQSKMMEQILHWSIETSDVIPFEKDSRNFD